MDCQVSREDSAVKGGGNPDTRQAMLAELQAIFVPAFIGGPEVETDVLPASLAAAAWPLRPTKAGITEFADHSWSWRRSRHGCEPEHLPTSRGIRRLQSCLQVAEPHLGRSSQACNSRPTCQSQSNMPSAFGFQLSQGEAPLVKLR